METTKLTTLTYSQLLERRNFARSYAKSMMAMILRLKQYDDRVDSIRQCALMGIECLKEVKRIEEYLNQDQTIELKVA